MLNRQLQFVITLALLVGQPSAAPAQSIVDLPRTRTNPTLPVFTQPEARLQAMPEPTVPSVPNVQIPIFLHQSSTILPTDSTSRVLPIQAGSTVRSGKAGEWRVFPISDLAQFLKEHGWAYGAAEPYDESLMSDDIPTIETDLGGDLRDQWVPISFQSGGEPEQNVSIRFAPSCPEVSLFSTPNQFVTIGSGGKNGTLVVGAPGTVISHVGSTVALYNGSMVIDTGNEKAVVLTRAGAITIGGQTAAIVDAREGKRLTVQALAAGNAPLKIKLATSSDDVHEIRQGESLTVDLGTGRTADVVEITNIDSPLITNITSGNRWLGHGAVSRLEKHLRVSGLSVQTTENPVSVPLTRATVLLGDEGTRFVVSTSGLIGLISGRMLIDTQAPQKVRTHLGDMYLQPRSLTAVERVPGQMRVFCCSEPSSAILVSDQFGIPLQWGEEVLITDHKPTVAEMIPQDGVGRRAFEVHQLKERYCSVADFSMGALLRNAPHLHLVRKPTTKAHTDLRGRLMKTAAALQLVTGAKGRYILQSDLQQRNS